MPGGGGKPTRPTLAGSARTRPPIRPRDKGTRGPRPRRSSTPESLHLRPRSHHPVPMGHPAEKPRRATYADLKAAPSGKVAELIGGMLHVMPRPAPKHANA